MGQAPSLKQAEAEAAQAEDDAQAIRLRRRAEEAECNQRDGEVRDVAGCAPAARSPGSRRRWMRRLRLKAVAVGAAVMLICASLGAIGCMALHHHTVLSERHRAAEFSAAARQGVVTLMSVDSNRAMEQSKASATFNVDAVAVESMTDDSAVVIVAARSDLTNPDNTKRDPESWRISIFLKRDGG